MITTDNIRAFITWLFQKRKGHNPPPELLDNWSRLSPEQLQTELNGLFAYWGMTEQEKAAEISAFLQQRTSTRPPATPGNRPVPPPVPQGATYPPQATPYSPPASRPVYPSVPYRAPRKSRAKFIIVPVILLLLAGGGWLVYKYLQFRTLGSVYAITDNIIVRDINRQPILRMDIDPGSDTTFPSRTRMKVYDNNVYYRGIDDGTNTTYPNRKVLLREDDFKAFVLNSDDNVGFVNTNYVVDNLDEFQLYRTVFRDVVKSRPASDELRSIFRRIVIGSMNRDKQLRNNYIVLQDFGIGNDARNTTPFIRITQKKDVAYAVYAGLNNNRYYRFEGDISDNFYERPVELLMYRKNENPEPLAGNYRFFMQRDTIYLYDSSEKMRTKHYAVYDGTGRITGFQFYEEPKGTPVLIDVIDEAGQILEDLYRKKKDPQNGN